MNYTLEVVLNRLQRAGYLYKGRTVTKRTIRTMIDRGRFETARKCEGDHCWLVSSKEINEMIGSSL